jgi:type IV pilus assembly protein PilA
MMRALSTRAGPLRRLASHAWPLLLAAPLGACGLVKTADQPTWNQCQRELRFAYTAAKSFHQEKDRFSVRIHEIGFSPERGNRYAYFLAEAPRMQERRTEEQTRAPDEAGVEVDTFRGHPAVTWADMPRSYAGSLRLGISGQCPACVLTIACGAQLDADPTLDVWSISTRDRIGPSGELIPEGQPYHEQADFERPWWKLL